MSRPYTVAEAAKYLGITRTVLYRQKAAGKIEFVLFAGRYFVNTNELKRYDQARKRGSEKEKGI